MGCVLRVYGTEFGVKDFLRESHLQPYEISLKGELTAASKLSEHSGLKIDISEADFGNLPEQIADAIFYLKRNKNELHRLRHYAGVEAACLDFAIVKRDVFCQYDTFPAELLYLAEELGLDIELTQFSAEETENE